MLNDSDQTPRPAGCHRRQFLTRIGALAGAAAILPGLAGCETAEMHTSPPKKGATLDFDIAVDPFKPLAAVGGFVAADIEGTEVVLVRTAAKEVVALSRTCPHAFLDMTSSASSKFDVGKGVWVCGWHFSEFKADGSAVAGPAAPAGKLDKFTVSFDGAKGKVTL